MDKKEAPETVQEAEVLSSSPKNNNQRSKSALLRKAIWIHTWFLLSWAVAQQQVKVSAAVATPDPLPSATNTAAWPQEEPEAFESQQEYKEKDPSSNDEVIVIAAVDGTIAGLSRATGETLWKQPGHREKSLDNSKEVQKREEHMRPKHSKEEKNNSSESRLLSPLVSTSTTTKSSEWKTAAVPSIDGRVYLTAGRESSAAPDVATSTVVPELVSRAPFLDDRGRFFVGSRHATAAAIDRDTGEILRVVSGDDTKETDDASLEDRNVVWLGRVDYSVFIYDARTGTTDAQFSTSEVMSVRDMIAGASGEKDEDALSAQPHAPRLMLPSGNGDAGGDPFHSAPKTSLLVATPNGNVALRNPETQEIEWVANETFDTPVAFALESSSGRSLGVDILPDAPVPDSSPEYISQQLERQMEALNNQDTPDDEQTIVGSLSSGQLYAMPLGTRQGSLSHHSLGIPHPHTLASMRSSSKQLHGSSSILGRQHSSHNLADVSSSHSTAIVDQKQMKKACSPSNPFPGCLIGNYHKGDGPLGASQQQHGHPLHVDGPLNQAGAVTLHYHPSLGYVAHEDQVHEILNRKSSRSFFRIMASWLPPTMALLFVLSFELGRRHKLRKKEAQAQITGMEEPLESVHKQITSSETVQSIGVIQMTDEVLGYGGHGTVVYRGMLDGRKVAVKRMLKAYHASADREISLLIESDGHPNVVRYFLKEARGDFVYLALELCDLSLHDMIGSLSAGNPSPLSISAAVKATLLQISSGVRHLHSLRIVHRDLKPANILLALTSRADSTKSKNKRLTDNPNGYTVLDKFEHGDYVAKISDMGLGKQLAGQSSFGLSTLGNASVGPSAPSEGSTLGGAGPGSVGWQAPEVMAVRLGAESSFGHSDSSLQGGIESSSPVDITANTRTSRSVDIFSLGCIFYCTLIPGSHPFGEWYEREANIMRNKPSTEALEELSQDAFDLVTAMIHRDPKARPTAKQVCCHPFFWSRQQRLGFLCDISDRLESGDTGSSAAGTLALVGNSLVIERNAAQVVGIAWDKELDVDLINNVARFRTYDPSSVRDLLRLVRNKHHHYDELPADVKERIGSNPDGLQQYFEERFPRLLMHCFTIFRECMTPEDPLAGKYSISPIPSQLQRKASQTSSISETTESVVPVPSSPERVMPAPVSEGSENNESEDDVSNVVKEQEEQSSADDGSFVVVQDSPSSVKSKEVEAPTPVAPVQENLSTEAAAEEEPACSIIVWEGSTAAKSFGCRGWIRSDDEWIRRTDAALRKRDSNVARCADDPKFRTRLCNHWDVSMGTFCPMRRKNKCVFAHGPVELRVKEGKRNRWGKLVDAEGNNSNLNHSGGEDTYGAARSIETARKEEGKWNTNKKGKGRQQGKKK